MSSADDGLALAVDVGGTTIKAELVDRAETVDARQPGPGGDRRWTQPGLRRAACPLRVALRQWAAIVHPADVTASALGDRGGVIGGALLARDGWALES